MVNGGSVVLGRPDVHSHRDLPLLSLPPLPRSTPVGSLLMVLQKYHGETVQERKQKDRQALHEQKLQEW